MFGHKMAHKLTLHPHDVCRYKNVLITNIVFDHKMAHKLTWYSLDCKTANLIDYVIVNRRLAGSIQYTRLHRSAVVYYLLGSCDVGRFQDGNLRESFLVQLRA